MTDLSSTSAEAMEAAAMPDARVVRLDRDDDNCAERQPLPAAVARTAPADKSPAEWPWQRLALYIQKFEESIDKDEEVGMALAGSDAGTLRIAGMGYFAPDILTFYGTDSTGLKTQLIQHVSQLSVLLRALPKQTEEPTRIGFRLRQELDQTPEEDTNAEA